MHARHSGWWVWCVVGMAAGNLWGQQNPHGQVTTTSFPEPFLVLVRDPVVHGWLGLNATQRKAVQETCDRADLPLWSVRLQPAERQSAEWQSQTAAARSRLVPLLTATQKKRLEQIELHVRGAKALLDPAVGERLGVSEEQRTKLGDVIEEYRKKSESLGTDESAAKQRQAWSTERQQKFDSILTRDQRTRLVALFGESIDTNRLGRVKFRAPPIDGSGPWLNSPPQTLESLRGKVVAVHFFAFGCINCIRNYPWYRGWHDSFADQGLVLVGVHTPETRPEHDIESLRRKLAENRLTFPVVADNDKRTWNAWGNSMWPSVYLVDKQGYVRAWWYGELNWQGQEGEKLLRQRISELLAE